ncbi:MAG: hypothetical protein HUN04_15890 [Desulfobacter sp.]|nr:MAG: hypothetical protein HUN04_15890 [Desulfobacter sp.]
MVLLFPEYTNLKRFKILVTKLDKRTRIGNDYYKQVRAGFSDHSFQAHIPATLDFKYAEQANQTILQNAVRSAAARTYRAVVNEILEALDE